MIIEQKAINEAKEKLGDKNAEIMADLLCLDGYDEVNLKACCPFHDEDTASFIYNKKNYTFHCFGCQKTVDILDILMMSGRTFIEACKELFEYAGISYSFGEANVKTRASYRYPHDEDGDMEQVIEYFGKRGISTDTLDYCDVGSDGKGNGVFKYYDTNDVLTMVKYRPARTVRKGENKTWCQKDADTTPLLFNMNRINTTAPLLVVEGECYKGDTEVLTPDGWVRLDSYNGQQVLQIDDNMNGSFITPIAYVSREYDGDLYTYERGGNFSLTTTKEHNWVYIDYMGRTTKRKICDFPKSLGLGYIPTTTNVDNSGINMSNDEIALYLAISADGTIDKRGISCSHNYARVQLKKPRKIERLESILKSCGYEYSKTNPKSRSDFTFFGIKIPKSFSKDLPFEWVYKASLKQRKFIIEEMVHWDGNHVPNREQYEYSSNRIHNAEVIQAIAHTCGYMSTIMRRKNKYGSWYKVSILLKKNRVSYYRKNLTIEPYAGKVYCVTVPTGIILVRQNKHIAICGNCDAMSAIEAGYYNVVSVPLGCGNLHWIEENWEFLEQFSSIIVAFDNDEPGRKARKEVIYRLGSWRTKYIEYPEYKELPNGKKIPINDMNDTLQAFGPGYVLSMIINAKEIPVSSVTDFSDVDDLDISDMNGVETGIKPLDKELIKIFNGTLTILSGRPGSGKTSMIDQVIAQTMDDGIPVFLFSKEMPERMTANWLNSILAGRRNLVQRDKENGEKYDVVSYKAKEQIKQYYKGKLYIYKDTESNAIDDVMKSMEECVRKYGVKLLVIDNLMMLDLKCNETEKNTAQTNLVNDLIKFASKFNVSVVLIAHPRKTQDMQSDIEMYDIAGSSNIINLAMRSIGLRRVTKKEKEDYNNPFRNHNVVLTIMKDRLLGKADKQIGLYYDVKSRRFFTDYDEFDHQYNWDKNVYDGRIPYPVEEEQRPFD